MRRRHLLPIAAAVALGAAILFVWSRQPGAPGTPGSRDTPGADVTAAAEPQEPGSTATGEPPAQPTTVIAAADIACDPEEDAFRDGEGREGACQQMATSELALDADPDLVLIPGDTQYEEAELADYRRSFHPSWGRLKDRILPVPGNHEYDTDDAAGYFAYFGDAAGDPFRGYYAVEEAGWLITGGNSVCEEVGGCEPGDEQFEWLRETLEASDATCQLAFWHHPRWSNGNYEDDDSVASMYELLHEHGVELLLSGDSHNYQGFEPLDPDREPDPQGVRQFVVGAAGKNLREAEPGRDLAAANFEEMGVLALELRPDAYSWEFLSTGDAFTDTGSAACH